MGQRKQHVTSVRLDDFQRMALVRIGKEDQRSVSFLIGRAIDRYVEEELHRDGVTRRSHEETARAAQDRALLSSFTPAIATIDELEAPVAEEPPAPVKPVRKRAPRKRAVPAEKPADVSAYLSGSAELDDDELDALLVGMGRNMTRGKH